MIYVFHSGNPGFPFPVLPKQHEICKSLSQGRGPSDVTTHIRQLGLCFLEFLQNLSNLSQSILAVKYCV